MGTEPIREKWNGFPYPIQKSAGGYLYKAQDYDLMKANLRQLLLTTPGERVMLPDYGAGLRRFVFEPLDDTLLGQIRAAISEAIETWEPRIVVNELSVTKSDDNNAIYIHIEFALTEDLSTVDALDMKLEVNQ